MPQFEFWAIFCLISQQPLTSSISSLQMKNSPEQVTSFTCDTLLLAYIGYISGDLLTKHFYMCNFKWAGLHLSGQIEKAML